MVIPFASNHVGGALLSELKASIDFPVPRSGVGACFWLD